MVQIVKPAHVLHVDEKERPISIFTISIHPDGSRLATGGLDTKVKVWSTAPILRREVEEDETHPKLLCTMTSHSGVVMCVRWSTKGRFLASGSDDNIVMIWNLETGSGGKVWGSTETNVENWKAVRRLVGHDSDVSGVAWNADDTYLASVSLDSTVLIWSGQSFDLVRKLTGHQGFVKGVVFDPVGQYLATQSDDNTVKIWRTEDWRLQADITAPFKDSPKTNLSRLSWSPEGTYIVTPNSMNGPVFVAAVIDRQNWTSKNSMVGHTNIVEVTAFNPLIFLRDPKVAPSGQNLCTILALSARNSISLWITSQSQPIMVLDEVFDRDVLDMSWSADGTQLWSCSSEGHVAVFQFALSELGIVAPPGTKEAHHATYNFQQKIPDSSRSRTLSQNNSSSSLAGPPAGTIAQPNMLVSRKGPGAKRRVEPKSHVPVQPLFQSSPSQSRALQTFQPPIQSNAFASTSTSSWGGVFEEPSKKRKAHFEASPDEGSERLAPGPNPYSRFSDAPNRSQGRTLGEDREAEAMVDLRELRPAYAPRERGVTFMISNQRNRDEGGKGVRVLGVPAVKSFGTLRVEDGAERDTLEWRNFGEGERKGGSEVAVVTLTKTLWVDYLSNYVVCAAGSPRFVAVSTEDGSLHVYSPSGRRILPTIVMDSPCSLLEAEGVFLMAITSLGTVHVWNTSLAKVVFPSLSLSTLLTSSSTATEPHPMITTSAILPNGAPLIALSSGSTHSYDVDLASWIRLSDTWWSKGSDFWENRRGKAVTSGRGVIRGIESAINDIVVDSALDMNVDDSDDSEADGDEPSSRRKTIPEGTPVEQVGKQEMFRTAVSLGHMEVRMKGAVALESAAEYKVFLSTYAKKLAEEGFRNKAEELIKELLGPVYFKLGKTEEWIPTIVGLNKRDLLKEVLSTFAKSRMLAALAVEYQELLKKLAA